MNIENRGSNLRREIYPIVGSLKTASSILKETDPKTGVRRVTETSVLFSSETDSPAGKPERTNEFQTDFAPGDVRYVADMGSVDIKDSFARLIEIFRIPFDRQIKDRDDQLDELIEAASVSLGESLEIYGDVNKSDRKENLEKLRSVTFKRKLEEGWGKGRASYNPRGSIDVVSLAFSHQEISLSLKFPTEREEPEKPEKLFSEEHFKDLEDILKRYGNSDQLPPSDPPGSMHFTVEGSAYSVIEEKAGFFVDKRASFNFKDRDMDLSLSIEDRGERFLVEVKIKNNPQVMYWDVGKRIDVEELYSTASKPEFTGWEKALDTGREVFSVYYTQSPK